MDISFSNDKGFEPSTPSQGSPPSDKQIQSLNYRVKNPLELFNARVPEMPRVSAFKVETPTSKRAPQITQSLGKAVFSPRSSYLPPYETRYSSNRKQSPFESIRYDRVFPESPRMHHSTIFESQNR